MAPRPPKFDFSFLNGLSPTRQVQEEVESIAEESFVSGQDPVKAVERGAEQLPTESEEHIEWPAVGEEGEAEALKRDAAFFAQDQPGEESDDSPPIVHPKQYVYQVERFHSAKRYYATPRPGHVPLDIGYVYPAEEDEEDLGGDAKVHRKKSIVLGGDIKETGFWLSGSKAAEKPFLPKRKPLNALKAAKVITRSTFSRKAAVLAPPAVPVKRKQARSTKGTIRVVKQVRKRLKGSDKVVLLAKEQVIRIPPGYRALEFGPILPPTPDS